MTEWDLAEELERLGRRRDWVVNVPATFAERFSKLRKSGRGGSQQHIALVMGLIYGHTTWHQTTVAKVESGDREVRLAEAVALAEILRVPLSELIGTPTSEVSTTNGEHSEET